MNNPRKKSLYCALAVLAGIGLVIAAGMKLRHNVWDTTARLRFHNDITNAFEWGTYANRIGYRALYDSWLNGGDFVSQYPLDYAPLRLLAVTLWTRWLEARYPGMTSLEDRYAYARPLLYANRCAELAAAAAVFVLVLVMGARRTDGSSNPPTAISQPLRHLPMGRSTWAAAAAACLFWFNPALMLNAHGWPQWDVWVLPFFLWAAVLAHYGKWDGAGFLLAAGAMLKGQVLIVAPMFLLWAILARQFFGAFRLMLGVALATALIAAPWLVGGKSGAIFVGSVCLAGLAFCWFLYAGRRVRLRTAGFIMEGVIPAAMVASLLFFDGSLAWFQVAFLRSAEQFSGHWIVGMASNLPAILKNLFQWKYEQSVSLPFLPAVRITTLLALVYVGSLIYCSVLLVRHERKQDRRFLMAVVMPWLLMYTLLPKMHERYLMYSASLSAMWVAMGSWGLLCHLFLTGLSLLGMLHTMLIANHAYRDLERIVRETHPDAGWALCVVVVALLFVMGRTNHSVLRGGDRTTCPRAGQL